MHLCSLNVRSGKLDCQARAITQTGFQTRPRGCVYAVAGSIDAPVMSVSNGRTPTEHDLRFLNGYNAVLDAEETVNIQIKCYRENQLKIEKLGEMAEIKKHGSNQSDLASFDYLCFNNATSLTREAISVSHEVYKENPEP